MATAFRVSVLRMACLIAIALASPPMASAAPITFEFTTTVVSVEHAFLGVQSRTTSSSSTSARARITSCSR